MLPADETKIKKVPSVVQALKVLRHLADYPAPQGVNAIARALGINPSSCFNILKTLALEEFVEFDAENKTYSIGPGSIILARRALDPHQSFELVRSLIVPHANKFEATCMLWRLDGMDRMTMIGFVEGLHGAGLHLTVGQRLPVSIGAAGRSFMASMGFDRKEVRRHFSDLHWQIPPTFEQYWEEVGEAARKGWSCDDGAYIRGITTVAAPVLDSNGAPRMAIGTSTIREKVPDRLRWTIGVATIQLARSISGRLYGRFKGK